MSILNLIANNNYIVVNKTLIQKLGLYEAVILGELASEYVYWQTNNKLENGFFFSTVENIEANTGINGYYQRQAIKKLTELGIVETKKVGLPAKRFISINEQQLMQLLNDKLSSECITSDAHSEPLDVHPVNSNNNNIIIISNNNKEYKKENNKRKKFEPPTLEEIKNYCEERKNNVDAKRFFDYYNAGNWQDNKGNPIKNWKQKIIAVWENKSDFNAAPPKKIEETNSMEDFYKSLSR